MKSVKQLGDITCRNMFHIVCVHVWQIITVDTLFPDFGTSNKSIIFRFVFCHSTTVLMAQDYMYVITTVKIAVPSQAFSIIIAKPENIKNIE